MLTAALAAALLCAAEAAAAENVVVTQACDPSDPAQQFTLGSDGSLSTEVGGGKRCVVVDGCLIDSNAKVVLGPCGAVTKCSAWALHKPPHPSAPGATWIVAPGSPAGQPRCLENPQKAAAGSVDIYCCSCEAGSCGSVYPTALPWQQWSVSGVGTAGFVQNLGSGPAGGAKLCLAVAPGPPPPLTIAPVWPLPKALECPSPGQISSVLLSSAVTVALSGPGASSKVGTQSNARLLPLLKAAGVPRGAITSVSVTVQSADETLSRTTNYSYSIDYTSGSGAVKLTAASPYAVAYALESLLQLSDAKFCAGGSFALQDAPDFPHRGVMIDTGRRFYSVGLVESILEGMAMMKMNVMHMFLSELCFRVESKQFPGLHTMNCTGPNPRPGLINNGFYTQDDIAHLVGFAAVRGIRIIPEFDMPGHSGGFCHGLKSAGIVCCQQGGMGVPQIQDDTAGKSVALIKQVLHEMSTLFPDSVLHIGGDETGAIPPCTTADTTTFEEKIIAYADTELNRTVMGWEEVLFKSKAAVPTPAVIIDSWERSSWQQAATLGHRAVASNSDTLYLDIHSHVSATVWEDIRGGTTNATLLSMLLGGETSMWQDYYVPGARTRAEGSASCLFSSNRDVDFDNSTSSTIWPRAAIAGGSFWGFSAALDSKSALFESVVEDVKRRLAGRGINVCPCATATALGCEQNSFCGKVWCPGG